jgi:hypothetical protein
MRAGTTTSICRLFTHRDNRVRPRSTHSPEFRQWITFRCETKCERGSVTPGSQPPIRASIGRSRLCAQKGATPSSGRRRLVETSRTARSSRGHRCARQGRYASPAENGTAPRAACLMACTSSSASMRGALLKVGQLAGHFARRRRIRGNNRKCLHETMLAMRR